MSKTIRLTTGQALARFLQNQYSQRDGKRQRLIPAMFGIFGHGNLSGIGQGLMEYGSEIKFYQPFHEQSMVHAAVAYARAKRRLSTFACTSSIGPGTANLYTGAAGATINRVPVLLLPSDHYATRRQGVVLQQLEHPVSPDIGVADGLRTVSTYFDKITRPEQIISSLLDAMRTLTSPADAGAVTLSICQGVQAEAFDYPEDFFNPRTWRVERRPPEPEAIGDVVALLKQARQPVIVSGGGVYYSEAEAELQAFVEEFGVPVVETFAGKGTIPGDSELALGGMGMCGTSAANSIVAQADLVLAIGTRLADTLTCSQSIFRNPKVRFASINVSSRDTVKQAALPVLADARLALLELSDAAREAGVKTNPAWLEGAHKAKTAWTNEVAPSIAAPEKGTLTQSQALAIVNSEVGENSIVAAAAGSLPGDLHKLWNTTGGKYVQNEFGFSCMTYEIPAGIGIAISQEYSEVCVCIGDGTYLMNMSPLLTAVRENLDLTVVIFINDGYQIIRDLQVATTGDGFGTEFRARNGGRDQSGEYLQIDYVRNVESLGAKVFPAIDAPSLREALRSARQQKGPAVVTIVVDRHTTSIPGKYAWWDIAPPEVSNDSEVQKLRDEHDRGAQSIRYHL